MIGVCSLLARRGLHRSSLVAGAFDLIDAVDLGKPLNIVPDMFLTR
jgi:hypothetical protein